MRFDGLGWKIAVRMAGATLAVLAATTLGAFGLYSWVFQNVPGVVASPDDWAPETLDYLAFAAFGALALTFAAAAGVQLARRIVIPLASLAQAARRITAGDLSARASAGDRSPGETADLVADFNAMAERLETLAEGMRTWNASIAHELRTPVTILQGRLQGVSDGVFVMDEALTASLLKQVGGLALLVEDLRVVSLADSGRLQLQKTPANLAAVIADLRPMVEPRLAEAGMSTEWRLAPVVLNCDPVRIRQAVLALVENACRHAVPGPLWITVETRDDEAVVRVEDSGPGLTSDFAVAAFAPFRRGSDQGGGSGLGLSVVRVIAEAHGGSALYRAGDLGGAAFEILLPQGGDGSFRKSPR